jgi:poly-beta-1,6-N-acetyl-D-glucosamine synthase
MKWGFPFSISFFFWGLIGLLRVLVEKIIKPYKHQEYGAPNSDAYYLENILKVAVCLPAHNEELVIQETIDSIKLVIPIKHCFVVSDNSDDDTVKIARKNGCKVLDLKKSHGKARALEKLIESFKLLDNFNFILFVDADTTVNRNYLKYALPVFQNPKVVAIAAYARNFWTNPKNLFEWRHFITAYRVRLFFILQLFLMYAQTFRYLNVLGVIPGFAAMYRTETLKKLKLYVPGLAIEDFNMAFQVHKKKLGLIAHYREIFAVAKGPSSLDDYRKQITRWNVGFFQTVRHWGVWPSLFWLSLGVFTLEILINCLFYIFLPVIIVYLTVVPLFVGLIDPTFLTISNFISENYITFWGIVVGVVIVDYFFTILTAVFERKPIILLYGLGFLFFRVFDSIVFLTTFHGLITKSTGIWKSPKRGGL